MSSLVARCRGHARGVARRANGVLTCGVRDILGARLVDTSCQDRPQFLRQRRFGRKSRGHPVEARLGRQSGTSASPSIVNASPEAAVGGGLALLKIGDRVRVDLNKGTAEMLVSRVELARRRAELDEQGGYQFPQSQTPWQGIQRNPVDQLTDGMVLKPAVEYQRVAQRTVPRNSH
jgi:hypothetical protein